MTHSARAGLVSAIIPTHGRPDFLARALASVFSQTWDALEVIVVDDNGRGEPQQLATATLVDEQRDRLERERGAGPADVPDGAPPARELRYVVNERNGGGGFARNAGVAAARGEFLAFLDDDDEWLPRFVERGLRTLEERAADIVYCDCLVVDDARPSRARHEVNAKHEGDVRAALIGGWCPSSTSLFVLRRRVVDAAGATDAAVPDMTRRESEATGDLDDADREALEPATRTGPFDPALASFQDYDCWLGLSAHARFAFHEEPLVIKHRHRAGQITSNTDARRGALDYLAAKWLPRLAEAERPRFREALAALEHDILRMEFRNALHGRRWRRAADRARRYVTGRGSMLRNAVALLRAARG